MTTAEKISAQFDDDGACFFDAHGNDIREVMASEAVEIKWRDGYNCGSTVRYTFADDSAILVCGEGWDYGYTDCFCWHNENDPQPDGHGRDCVARIELHDAPYFASILRELPDVSDRQGKWIVQRDDDDYDIDEVARDWGIALSRKDYKAIKEKQAALADDEYLCVEF